MTINNPFENDDLVNDLFLELTRALEVLAILRSGNLSNAEVETYKHLFSCGLIHSHSLFHVLCLGKTTNPQPAKN